MKGEILFTKSSRMTNNKYNHLINREKKSLSDSTLAQRSIHGTQLGANLLKTRDGGEG